MLLLKFSPVIIQISISKSIFWYDILLREEFPSLVQSVTKAVHVINYMMYGSTLNIFDLLGPVYVASRVVIKTFIQLDLL